MPRPHCCRRIGCKPDRVYFKPVGVPLTSLEEVVLGLDEFEALRLADLEGMYQEEAAGKMNVSRPTFARIVESARRKVAEVLVKGKALKIEGGNVMMTAARKFRCSDCGHAWDIPHGTGRPAECPQCNSRNIHRAEEDRGWARCGGPGRHGRGWCGRGAGRPASGRTNQSEKPPEGGST
jgi:predicted DNA-binding protein (UPF0251 family)